MKVYILISSKVDATTEIMSVHETETGAWKAAAYYLKEVAMLSIEEIGEYKDYITAAKNWFEVTEGEESFEVNEFDTHKSYNISMDFTVLVAVYNAPEATELTLRTLLAAANKHISKVLVLDSSTNHSNLIQDLIQEYGKKFNLIKAPVKVLHPQAIHTLLQLPILTPYVFITDSDVEYFDDKHFVQAQESFESSPKLAIIGEYIPKHQHPILGNNNFFPARIGPWAMFARTNVIKSHRDTILPIPPKISGENTYHYDMGMGLFEAITNSGYEYMNQTRTSYHHFIARSRVEDILPELDHLNIPREHAYEPDIEIKEKISRKIWRNLESS